MACRAVDRPNLINNRQQDIPAADALLGEAVFVLVHKVMIFKFMTASFYTSNGFVKVQIIIGSVNDTG